MNQTHDAVPVSVRLPADLRDRLRRSATANRRSLSSEIVFQLEQALPDEETATGEQIGVPTPAAAQS